MCSWLEPFFGKEKDIAECEGLMLTIPEELRGSEIELYSSKWFDYRGLHPVKATYFFAHCFDVGYRRAYAATRDFETSKTIKPFMVDDPFRSGDIIGLWRARQTCDNIGVSYEFYVSHALKVCYEGGWRRIPRPNQIYSDAMIDEVVAAWESHCKDILQIVQDKSLYGSQQVSEWYINQLKKRPSPEYTASKLLRVGILTAEQITEGLDASVAKRAIRLSSLD